MECGRGATRHRDEPSRAIRHAGADQAIERLATSFRGVLLIDEAYVDFVDPALAHDTTSLIARHPNILLLRTLSKGYSLAGLRLGYGLGNAALVAPILDKTKDSYNVDGIAQILGAAALEDTASREGLVGIRA